MILPYQDIKRLCEVKELIQPAVERSNAFGMTFGYSAAGYDVRVAQSRIMMSGEFVLVSTIEHFVMPDDLIAQVCDKSTWARQGLAVQNTIIEPGWRGYLTLELTNHSMKKIMIQEGMPICQIIFMRLTRKTEMPYRGKYQDQPEGPVTAIMENS